METNTVKLHRVFKTTPEKLYKAFLDPAAMCKMAAAEWVYGDGRSRRRARWWDV